MPVILWGNDLQKKKYLGRMTEEPLVAVRELALEWVETAKWRWALYEMSFSAYSLRGMLLLVGSPVAYH